MYQKLDSRLCGAWGIVAEVLDRIQMQWIEAKWQTCMWYKAGRHCYTAEEFPCKPVVLKVCTQGQHDNHFAVHTLLTAATENLSAEPSWQCV